MKGPNKLIETETEITFLRFFCFSPFVMVKDGKMLNR